uniref:Reverse transcriptase domain-containing protein n=1 Tax=Lactuca sativa TaxID=4236 RepID=A0A9R1X3I0_LACSA|nr:hypothetical protein LSAT_V11C700348820 [Lactuca sativa]
MIINEMYNRDKKSKTKMFFLKVDFDKAFDSINWNYLDSIGYKEISHYKGCSVRRSSFSILVYHCQGGFKCCIGIGSSNSLFHGI